MFSDEASIPKENDLLFVLEGIIKILASQFFYHFFFITNIQQAASWSKDRLKSAVSTLNCQSKCILCKHNKQITDTSCCGLSRKNKGKQ